jgi:hypothetical protein
VRTQNCPLSYEQEADILFDYHVRSSGLRDIYPGCGTPELYDLALDYMREADKRYYQNLQDSECAKTQIPKGLFPETT